MPDARESLIRYLSNIPQSTDEIDRLVGDRILSREEAAVLNMRIAANKLDHKLDELIEKTDQLCEVVYNASERGPTNQAC